MLTDKAIKFLILRYILRRLLFFFLPSKLSKSKCEIKNYPNFPKRKVFCQKKWFLVLAHVSHFAHLPSLTERKKATLL